MESFLKFALMQPFDCLKRLPIMRLYFLFTVILLSVTIRSYAIVVDTTVTEKHFSKTQLNDDVSYLIKTVADVHPDMFHAVSKSKYQIVTDSVRNTFFDDMTGEQAWPAISRLIGILNEGHSVFNYPDDIGDQLKSGKSILFPVIIKEFNGVNLIVRADASKENKLQTGDQIVSINGITSAKLIDTLSGYAGGLKQYRSIDVCRNLVVYLYLYHINGPYEINYLRDGKIYHSTLSSSTWSAFTTRVSEIAKTLPKSLPKVDHSFYISEKNVANLTLNSLTAKPEIFKNFIDSCFTIIKNSPTKKLIIDLRNNGGGNSVLTEILLGYITEKPFRMTGGVKWKVSQEYKDRIRGDTSQRMSYYLNAKNGTLIENKAGNVQKPIANPLRYHGKIWVLIGPRTFSSANMLANTIQDYKLAKLIGEPSGAPANDYGELIVIKLPNTGFNFSTSTKQFVRANGNAKDQHPVIPDYLISHNPLSPIDEVLDFANKN